MSTMKMTDYSLLSLAVKNSSLKTSDICKFNYILFVKREVKYLNTVETETIEYFSLVHSAEIACRCLSEEQTNALYFI